MKGLDKELTMPFHLHHIDVLWSLALRTGVRGDRGVQTPEWSVAGRAVEYHNLPMMGMWRCEAADEGGDLAGDAVVVMLVADDDCCFSSGIRRT